MYGSGYFRPYVPVAERRKKAARAAAKMIKKGQKVSPVKVNGRAIASTFWGKAWCDHLESFSDFQNRLPRGRTYVRNGSVIHLSMCKGKVEALVQGSSLYNVTIGIENVPARKWKSIVAKCSGEIGAVVELLQGRLSSSVMKTITDNKTGLFPLPKEISLNCSCPDWAVMCKHVAAVLYGVGARLDHEPELLFELRHVNHLDLVDSATAKKPAKQSTTAQIIADKDLSKLFDIEIDTKPNSKKKTARSKVGKKKTKKVTSPRQSQRRKAVKKQPLRAKKKSSRS